MIEALDAEYVSVSIYSPLSGSSYTELPDRLKNSKKGLINIKNNDNKYFLWCHVRHLNPLKTHPERIIKADRRMISSLDCDNIKFPASKKENYQIGECIK